MYQLIVTLVLWSGSSQVGASPERIILLNKESCLRAAERVLAGYEARSTSTAPKVITAHCVPRIDPREG